MSRFLKTVLILVAVIVLVVALLAILGGDDGVLPFQYEGFG